VVYPMTQDKRPKTKRSALVVDVFQLFEKDLSRRKYPLVN